MRIRNVRNKQNWELMNTAVLTGRQVSQVMKVFIVTQAGKVADVTLQSSCQAEDESVIKVSAQLLLPLLHYDCLSVCEIELSSRVTVHWSWMMNI